MALVKDRMSSVQACSYTEDLSPLYGLDEYPKVLAMEDGGHINGFDKLGHDGLIIKNMTTSRSSSPLGSPNSSNSNEFAYHASSVHQANEPHHPLINIRPAGSYHDSFIQADTGSLLSFKQKEDYSGWEAGSMSYWDSNLSPTNSSDVRLFRDLNSFQTASNFGPMTGTRKDNGGNWLYTEATIVADHIQEPVSHEVNSMKRPNMGESMQAAKKQCNNISPTKKPKPKTESPSKDPQSIAAKQRRERISERLKTLQELVPNGSKVDLVTMLEKATSYVKFLQLQVKVLATDEFWPAQGGKAHDISQVKEAIEAILSSQKEKSQAPSNL